MSSAEPCPLTAPLNHFSLNLFRQVSSTAQSDNVFVSPFSVSTALSMLMLGAREGTEEQISAGLRLNLLDKNRKNVHQMFQELMETRIRNDAYLSLANYVLVQKESLDSNQSLLKFKNDVQSFYSAKVEDVNFTEDGPRLLTVVNDWVRHNTKGLIQKILNDPPSPDTRLILLNAIYFKGKWAKPFDKELTEKLPFYSRSDSESHTDFMTMYGKPFQYANEDMAGEKVQIVDLPYADNNSSMLIILPEKIDGLKRMLQSAQLEADVVKMCQTLHTEKTTLDLFVPKFTFETEYDLNDVLKDMGMSDMFTSCADLSGITGRKDLRVSQVKHKAMIKLDEEGTEAAAVTAMMVMRCCMVEVLEEVEFKADHPFLFLIKDKKSGLILFIGKVESV